MSALRHCAARIFFRVSMASLPQALRTKTPMPPPLAAREGHPADIALEPSTVGMLTQAAAALVRAGGQEPSLATLQRTGYENLPVCLPVVP
jgi:hypothetical protein